jgi:uroporphyrinogen-III decarboxylase
LEQLYNVLGDSVDVVLICGTDFGTQTSTFCSTETFENLYSPYYRKMNDWIHQNTAWKTLKHSCGAVEGFMRKFIEAGFDIINPVQLSAEGMDPKILKERYGTELTFWGGGIDTQKTLPFGSPKEVRDEVLSRCEVFSKGGGFVFNAVHNVQAKTPVENVAAMLEAVSDFNGKRI